MKFLIGAGLLLIAALPMGAMASTGIAGSASGKILLQVEANGEAWYVNPEDHRRYYLSRPDDAFDIMRFLGLGITDADLARIPKANEDWSADAGLLDRVRGRILLQVEQHGEAWYVNPFSGKRSYLGRPDDAFAIMGQQGVGATNSTIFAIDPNVEIISVDDNAERVTIRNAGRYRQALAGWSVTGLGNGGNRHSFSSSLSLAPGESRDIAITVTDRAKLYAERATLVQEFIRQDLPAAAFIGVPFTSQAPTGNWGSPFNEACEEAILVMLKHFEEGRGIIAQDAQNEILAIVDWEQRTYGFHEDTSADYTARTAREFKNIPVTVTRDVTEQSIKQYLADGKPVIVPVYGKYLYNPHFSNGGPNYHMVLIIGYEGGDFIVHEPGTRFGANYRYSVSILMNAIHDLTNPESLGYQGEKVMVVVE